MIEPCPWGIQCLWSTLVFLLEQPPYHYGSEVSGLFGLVGVVGAAAAPLVGRLADRKSEANSGTRSCDYHWVILHLCCLDISYGG